MKGKELEDKLIEVDNSLKQSNGYYFSKTQDLSEGIQPGMLKSVIELAKHSPFKKSMWGIKTPSTEAGSYFKENIITEWLP